MEVTALLYDLNTSYGLDLPETTTIEILATMLAKQVNRLITDDFNRLVQLLYRIDVNESHLRELLEQNPTSDSGRLVAQLILERLWEKILTRRMYSSNTPIQENQPNIDDEERW